MRGLKAKRIVVAGAATGIGRALAVRLAEEGANVMAADINATVLPETVAIAEAAADRTCAGGSIKTHIFDLADNGSIAALIAGCQDQLGGLDGMAIPAAYVGVQALRSDLALPNADPEFWERTMRINVVGHMMLIQSSLPLLKEAGGGSIVTVSSNSAYLGRATLPAYAASKAGLHGLIRHTARIGGPDKIRCNGVAPGLVMDPDRELPDPAVKDAILNDQSIKRIGRYADLAAAIAFLLSDDADWITGQVLSVNGGLAFRD